jgi:hypothetical protein
VCRVLAGADNKWETLDPEQAQALQKTPIPWHPPSPRAEQLASLRPLGGGHREARALPGLGDVTCDPDDGLPE